MQLGKLPQTGRPVMDFERNKKIGILGGTFNPPHNGHYYLAKKALEEFSLDLCRYLEKGEVCPKKGRYLFDYTDWSLRDLQTGQRMHFGRAMPVLPEWEA